MKFPFWAVVAFSLSGICTSNSVTQPKRAVTVEAKQFINLDCEYSTTDTAPYLFWYVQYPGRDLQYILKSLGRSEQVNATPRISAKHDIKKKVIPMTILDARASDSGVYFCALSDTTGGWKFIFGAGTKLTVYPKTDQTTPSVYKLKSDKPEGGLPDTVCLVTDFPSPNKTLKVDDREITLNDEAVLDKSTTDVWRYSAVLWENNSPNKNLSCKLEYDKIAVSPETKKDDTPQTCTSRTISENFKTDMNLNSLSFFVLGLRILVFKGLILNLVSTAKLWTI